MQPPPSPTRNIHNHNYSRGVPTSSPLGNANPTSPALAAALQGATRAFHNQKGSVTSTAGATSSGDTANGNTNSPNSGAKKPVGAGVETRGGKKDNGALLAATQAVYSSSRPRSPVGGSSTPTGLSRHVTGGSGAGNLGQETGYIGREPSPARGQVAQRLAQYGGGNERQQQGASSTSLLAATLAASRSASPSRGPSPTPQISLNGVGRSRGMSSAGVSSGPVGLGLGMGAEGPDTESIQPTVSLVSMFEKKIEEDVDPVKRRAPSRSTTRPDEDERARAQGGQQGGASVKPKPKPKPKLYANINKKIPSDLADEALETVSQNGETRGRGHYFDNDHLESQEAQQVRQSEPKAGTRPSTPSQPRAPRVSSPNVVSPRPKKPVKTPRLEPPTAPAKASATTKMTSPAVQNPYVRSETPVDTTSVAEKQTLASRRLSQDSASSDDTFVSASSGRSPRTSPPPRAGHDLNRAAQLKRPISVQTISTPDLHRPTTPRTSTPNISLDSLTNAIVASNLAAARLSTPSLQPTAPVPPPRRRGLSLTHRSQQTPLQPQRTAESLLSQLTGNSRGSHNRQTPTNPHHLPQQRTGDGSTTGRPSGMLLQTLRPHHPSSQNSSDDDEKRDARRHNHHRRRNHLLGGNRKHAHHEGSRRRWRDEITPRERRRYEAVWASNKGLFLVSSQGEKGGVGEEGEEGVEAGEMVVDVVVRDIWSRSRLPADELAEVWDLVDDGKGKRALRREEFVVGMWLIDQRLRGRKIPARVGGSVWESAGGRRRGN